MRIVGLLALLALSTLFGCSSGDAEDVGYQGSDEGFQAAQRAAATWNRICAADLVHVHAGRGAFDIHERVGIFDGDRIGATRTYTPNNPFEDKVITGVEFTAGPTAYGALVHELGHTLLGPEHTPGGVMTVHSQDLVDANDELLPGMITPEDCDRARASL